ncbi:MAG TPA: CBS domain-containing protein [Bacteroidetes bacterium]|nr:CBS domain-containing protein [Bacteroidota bacterium]
MKKNLDSMKVADVMTRDVIAVSESDKISDIAQLLTTKKIHGVPVIDNENRVVGIITETDFFTKGGDSLYIPSFIDLMRKNKLFRVASLKRKMQLKKILKADAKDIMSRGCITISPEADLNELLEILKRKGLHTVPVVDDDGVLKGIITLADIISLIKV